MILVIISHTAHYRNSNDEIVGWGPTVNEINYLLSTFKKIYHCAFLHNEAPPKSALPYTSSRIEFIPLSPTGGKSLKEKFNVLYNMPQTLSRVSRTLDKADIFQFRAPTGMGLYMIPFLTIFNNKKGWFKYAGNWKQPKPPLSYALQRWMLKRQSRQVTINGSWRRQQDHIITFDNPCLTRQDREDGLKAVKSKNFKDGLKLCFVGSLTKNKGFDILMESLIIKKNFWKEIHIVGDGDLKEKYNHKFADITFHGFSSKSEVNSIYAKCDFVILPSLSEGFPKVIAEGMNYGCIPVVSDVSGISQVIKNNENGFLINPINKNELIKVFERIVACTSSELTSMAKTNYGLAANFTYDKYIERLKGTILN